MKLKFSNLFLFPGAILVAMLATNVEGGDRQTLRKLGGPHEGKFNGTIEVKVGGVVTQRFVLENERGTVTVPGLQKKRAKITFSEPTLGAIKFSTGLSDVTLSRNGRVARAKSLKGKVKIPGVGSLPVTLVRPKVKRKGRDATVAISKIRMNADVGGGVSICVNAKVRGVGKY